MRLQITTRHHDLSPELRAFAEERVLRLKRYFDHILDVNLIVSTEKHRQFAEVVVHTNGHDWTGSAESGDMRTAIEDAVAKIEAQLRKHKDRVTDRKGRVPLGEALAGEAEAQRPPRVEIEDEE
jgi:putative sigma-54 modulation protein